jgi:hypothetical protein
MHAKSAFEKHLPAQRPPRLWQLIRPSTDHEIGVNLAEIEDRLRQQCQNENWEGAALLWHQLVVAKHQVAKTGGLL